MPDIDFYVLEKATGLKSWHFVAQLIEKLQGDEKKIYVYLQSSHDAERLDQFLWTYQDTSFIPHEIYQGKNKPCPVQIGTVEPQGSFDVLLNLQVTLPAFFTQFSHVIEIVFEDATVQQAARARFKQYRDSGYKINTHKLTVQAYDNVRENI